MVKSGQTSYYSDEPQAGKSPFPRLEYDKSQEDFLTQEAYEKVKRDYEIAKQTIRKV